MKLKFTYAITIVVSAFVLIIMQSNGSGRHQTTAPISACNNAGCHNVSIAPGTTIFDSIALYDTITNQFVNQYIPNRMYRIIITGRYIGTSVLPKFGFVLSNNGDGTLSAKTANTGVSTLGFNMYWGHNNPKDTTRSMVMPPFGTVSVYSDTGRWLAPAAGSGMVTFNGFINAVNGNNMATGDRSALRTRNFNEFVTPTANVTIARTTPPFGTICAGATVTFTATPVNGGTTPSYQWFKNGSPVTGTANTYTTTTLVNNDTIRCIMTSSIVGIPNNPATSNNIIVNVSPAFINKPSISANKNPVCAGDTVIYTCTPAAGSTFPQYRWFFNGVQVAGPPTSTATYRRNGGFLGNDSVWCLVNVSNACASPAAGYSDTIKMTVNSPVISNIANQTVCSGELTTMTNWSSSLMGTTYTWTNSNTNIGLAASGSGQIAAFTAINNGTGLDSGTISITPSVGACKGSVTRFKYYVKPTAKVQKPTITSFCSNQNAAINFVANPSAGSTINWTNTNPSAGLSGLGSGNISFTAQNVAPNDSTTGTITVRATLNGCLGPDSIFDYKIFPTPVISAISDVQGCTGQSIPGSNFTSIPSASTFSWTNNNNTTGLGSSGSGNYSAFTGTNSGTTPNISQITVNANYKGCAATPVNYNIFVNPQSPPSITISTLDTLICPNSPAIFRSTYSNGGNTPSFQWFLNGSTVGSNSDTLALSSVNSADTITCRIISNSPCATNPVAISNKLGIKTIPFFKHTVQLLSTKDTLCTGLPHQVTAKVTNGGSNPEYRWYVNDILVSSGFGAGSDVLVRSNWATGDVVYCDVKSSITCTVDTIARSNKIKFSVFPIIQSNISLMKNKSKICSDDYVNFTTTYKGEGDNPKFVWKYNGQDYDNNAPTMTTQVGYDFDVIEVQLISSHPCADPKISTAFISVDTVIQGPPANYSPNKYTTFCEGDSAEVKVFDGLPNYTYQWSNGETGTSFYSKSSMSYKVTITSPSYVCPRVYGPLTTYAQPLPTKPTVTLKSPGILEASISDNYQWQLNKLDIINANLINYVVSLDGLYRVKIINNAGCVAYSDEIDPSRASISSNISDQIKIYPNPILDGRVQIQSQNEIMRQLKIYDMSGKMVYQKDLNSKYINLHLDKLSKGIYQMMIQTDQKNHPHKIEIH